MKKFFQKTIIATLTCLMLTFSFGAKPVEADSAKAIEVVSEIGQRATEISENLMDLKILEASNIGGITKVGCAFRCVTSVVKLGFSILKLAGVFGTQKNPTQIIVEHLDNRFTAIDGELKQIDNRLIQMETSINKQLQDIDSSITRIDNTLSRANITKVAEISSKIMNDIKLFENTISSNVVDWYEVGNNPNYNRKLNVTYLANESTGETKTVYIPKELMDVVLSSADSWDINNQDTLVKGAFKQAITVAISGDVYTKTKNDFYEYCKVCKKNDYASLPEQDQTNVINDFSQAAYDSLRYECMKNIAKARTSSAKTYANDLIELYTNYCNYLCETGEHKSPLKSQYDVYSKTYAFQGELKRTIEYDADGNGTVETTEDTNLAALARDKYFGELNEMGAYVSEIAKASGAYTNDDLYNNIYYPWAKSEAALNEQYNNFYNVDNFGNDIDNYCYVTGTVLSYSLDNVEFRMMMSYHTYYKGSKYKVGTKDKSLLCDWKSSVGNQYLASSSELSKIYAYFSGERNGGRPTEASRDFYEFLKLYGVYTYNDTTIDEKSPLIITSFNGGIDLGSGDNVQMLAYGFPSTCDKYCDENNGKYPAAKGIKYKNDKTVYYLETINGSTPDMQFKRKAIANTFNALTGETITNNNVGTAAMYFKYYKNEDDMGMLIDAQYKPAKYCFNSGKDVDEAVINYNVDSAYKWPYEWWNYDSSISDTLIHVEIDYLRQYGAIIENDVNVYKANGKMSRTNTIELVANNVINSNDYVNKISFTNASPVINSSLIKESDKVYYEKVAENINKTDKNFQEKFVTLLKELYKGKESEIAKLEANKTYSITFDNKNYENLDMETYKEMLSKLISFLMPNSQEKNSNIDEMVETYRNLYSEITEIVDVLNVENNKMAVSLSNDDYLKLAENILKDEFGDNFVICENQADVLSYGNDKLVYCKENKKIYIWDSTKSEFVEWDSTAAKTGYKVVPNNKIAVDDSSISPYTNEEIDEIKNNYATAIDKPEKYIKNSEDGKYYQWIDISESKRSGSYVELTGKNIKVVSETPTVKDTEYKYIYNSTTNEYYQWINNKYEKITSLPDTIDNISVVDSLPTNKTTNFVYNTANNKYYKWMTNGYYSKLTINNVEDVKPDSYKGYIVEFEGDYYYWKANNVNTDINTNVEESGEYQWIKKVDSLPGTVKDHYVVVGDDCYMTNFGTNPLSYVKITHEIKTASDTNTFNGMVAKIGDDYYQWINKVISTEAIEDINPSTSGVYIMISSTEELPTSRTSNLVVYNGDCYLWKTVDGYIEVNELFEDDSIVKVAEVPSEFKGLVIQRTTDNKFYYWDDDEPSVSGGYVVNNSLVSTTGLEDGNKTYKYPYPYDSISDLKLCYQVKPIISFELYFDKEINNKADVGNANIKYNVVPYYDITPVLLWKDGSQAQQSLEISNEVLKDTGIKLMPIKIPVVQMNDANDTTALIYHFNSMDDTSSPIDQYNPAIKTDVKGNKYATIYVNSFSPFTVKKTYVRTETEKKNKFPVTGIE